MTTDNAILQKILSQQIKPEDDDYLDWALDKWETAFDSGLELTPVDLDCPAYLEARLVDACLALRYWKSRIMGSTAAASFDVATQRVTITRFR